MSLVLEECLRMAGDPPQASRQPLLSAEEFEGLLLEFGKPGHWSAGSLAYRGGGLPASGGLLGLSPRCQFGDLVVVDLSCHGGRPSPSFLRVPLP